LNPQHKLTLTALDDLKDIIADLVVLKSSNDSTSNAGTDGKAKFLELPFKWKDSTGFNHGILSAKDLAKAIQASITDPHSSHFFYRKKLVLYIPTSGLFCSREATSDCKDLSKILTKAPPALTKAKADDITAVSVSGAADAIANPVEAGTDASKTVHKVIDLSTAPPEVQQRYYKRLG
jgi:hypothetical protein